MCFFPPAAKLTLGNSFYERSEGDETVDICVLLKTDIKRNVGFELMVNQLTAEGEWYSKYIPYKCIEKPSVDGSDFNSPAVLDGTFTADGDSEICFVFNISDDNCVEDEESFEVVLLSSDSDVEFHISSANVTILDNDGKKM